MTLLRSRTWSILEARNQIRDKDHDGNMEGWTNEDYGSRISFHGSVALGHATEVGGVS